MSKSTIARLTVEKLLTPRIHDKYLLNTPLGRDFALVTTVGVEFKVHSMMLIGGPKMLQEGLYPGGVSLYVGYTAA